MTDAAGPVYGAEVVSRSSAGRVVCWCDCRSRRRCVVYGQKTVSKHVHLVVRCEVADMCDVVCRVCIMSS